MSKTKKTNKNKKIDKKKIVIWVLIIALLLSTFSGVFMSIWYDVKYGSVQNSMQDVILGDPEMANGQIIFDDATGKYYQIHIDGENMHTHEVTEDVLTNIQETENIEEHSHEHDNVLEETQEDTISTDEAK